MCDTLVALAAATEHGSTLFAKNSDRPPDEVQHVVWSPPRRDRHALAVTHVDVDAAPGDTLGCLLSIPDWCWGAEHGVNEAGVAIGNEAIYTVDDPRATPVGLTGMDIVRLALERAAGAADAVAVITDLVEHVGQGGTGHDPNGAHGPKAYWSSFLVADPLRAFVVETSGRRWAVEAVDVARAISNRTTIPQIDALRHPRQPVERLVDPRWQASNAFLARRPVTVAGLQHHLRSHEPVGEPGWSVCMHAADASGRPIEATTASMIAELPVVGAPRVWVVSGHPCRNDYTELPVGPSPAVAG